MASLRRNLRVFAAAWLMLQAVALNAFVPRDCCAGHRPAAASCHEPAATPAHCPMRAAGNPPCAMHGGAEPGAHDQHASSQRHSRHEEPRQASCRMIGTCDGPIDALVTLLSTHGTVPQRTAMLLPAPAIAVAPDVREDLTRRFAPPDSPPPRA